MKTRLGRVFRAMSSVFIPYIGLMKHYVADGPLVKRANAGFVTVLIKGSVQGQDRREPNTCETLLNYF